MADTGGRVKRVEVMAMHPALKPVNTSDTMDEHAEGVHVALSSTALYRKQKRRLAIGRL